MTYLADVNFWIALAFQRHIHSAAASEWFEKIPESSCAFCRLTQQGFCD